METWMNLTATNTDRFQAPVELEPQRRRNPESFDDATMREALLEQREDALSEAYRRHGRQVFRVAYGILRRTELAEDVTQEVFVRLWQRPERFDPTRGSLGGFLQLDAHGRSIDLLRSEQSRINREIKEQHLSSASASPISIEEEVMKRISSEEVRDALGQLRPEERSPIAMAFFLGHSYRTVAEILGVPEGTVKSRIRTGMARLRELLGTEVMAFA
jgi:RNA polymerase sigma-70 factor (ECF subfamily)